MGSIADEKPVRFRSGFEKRADGYYGIVEGLSQKAAFGYMEIVKKVNMAYARLSEYEDFKAHMAFAVNDSDYDVKDCEIRVSGNKEVELLVSTFDKFAHCTNKASRNSSSRSNTSKSRGGAATESFVARNGRFTVDIPAKSGVIYEVK